MNGGEEVSNFPFPHPTTKQGGSLLVHTCPEAGLLEIRYPVYRFHLEKRIDDNFHLRQMNGELVSPSKWDGNHPSEGLHQPRIQQYNREHPSAIERKIISND